MLQSFDDFDFFTGSHLQEDIESKQDRHSASFIDSGFAFSVLEEEGVIRIFLV